MRTVMATAVAAGDGTNVWGFVLEIAKVLGVGAIGLIGALFGARSARKTSREQFDAQRLAAQEDRKDQRAEARRDEKLRLYSLFWESFFIWHMAFERATVGPVDYDQLWAAYEKWRPSQYAPLLVSSEATSEAIRTLHVCVTILLRDAKQSGALPGPHRRKYNTARTALRKAMRDELEADHGHSERSESTRPGVNAKD